MPTYEYVCAKCNRHFEKVQRITDKALTVCPEDLCPKKPWGKGKVKRVVVAGAGLIFKGSGFYQTDYRSEGYKAAAKKEAAALFGASSDSAKKDTKAATPPKPQTNAPAPPKSDTGTGKK